MATNTPREPVLELDTQEGEPRRTITIDGEKYELRHMNELSLSGRLKFARRLSKLSRLAELDTQTYAQLSNPVITDLENSLHACVRQAVIAPNKVLNKLDSDSKMRIVSAFSPAAEEEDEAEEDESAEEDAMELEAAAADEAAQQEAARRSSPEPTTLYPLSRDSMEAVG